MTDTSGVWPWSSYRAVMGKAAPEWLAVDEALRLFQTMRGPGAARLRAVCRRIGGINAADPFGQTPRAGFPGSESFIEAVVAKFDNRSAGGQLPKKSRAARNMAQIAKREPPETTRSSRPAGPVHTN